MSAQRALWGEPAGDVEPDGEDTDSYCTPPEVLEPVHAVAGRPTLDPWTNRYAIAHGWVHAHEAWTLADGRHPDSRIDKRVWPLDRTSFVWGNPPYSDPEPCVRRFCSEVTAAGCWGMLLMKTDNRTKWWGVVSEYAKFLIMWRGPVNFFHKGERIKGNNFANTIMVIDASEVPHAKRHRALVKAFETPGLGWVYR